MKVKGIGRGKWDSLLCKWDSPFTNETGGDDGGDDGGGGGGGDGDENEKDEKDCSWAVAGQETHDDTKDIDDHG
ncbi:hypothetical protein AgCh_011446 [Apium graveolens]